MKRTLLAVGIAVLASMLFTPHGSGLTYLEFHTPVWFPRMSLRWFPIFFVDIDGWSENRVLWANFAGQTAFVSVFAAVPVNLRKPREKQSLKT